MNIFQINLNEIDNKYENMGEIRIVPLADVHIGEQLLDKKRLNETIEYIRDNDNVFTILNGDLLNTALKNSVSDVYNETMSPMDQVKMLVELLKPIRDKILIAHIGNHERRIAKDTSIDVMYFVMSELGLQDRYSSKPYYLYLYFGNKERGRKAPMVYTIFGRHGEGAGGRKVGSKINKVVEMSETCVADVFLMSHVHTQAGTKRIMYIPDYGNKTLVKREMLFAISNSFLDYGGYGAQYGFSPVSTTRIEIILNGTKRESKLLM